MGQSPDYLICENFDCPRLNHIFHPHCVQMVGSSCTLGVVQATKYRFTPTKYEDSRRRRWIRDYLTLQLSEYYGHQGLHLAPELWRFVADELQQHYSVAYARSLWSPNRTQCGPITTGENIWCGFVDFEGI